MIKLLAETPWDQEMIEKFQSAYENRRLRVVLINIVRGISTLLG